MGYFDFVFSRLFLYYNTHEPRTRDRPDVTKPPRPTNCQPLPGIASTHADRPPEPRPNERADAPAAPLPRICAFPRISAHGAHCGGARIFAPRGGNTPLGVSTSAHKSRSASAHISRHPFRAAHPPADASHDRPAASRRQLTHADRTNRTNRPRVGRTFKVAARASAADSAPIPARSTRPARSASRCQRIKEGESTQICAFGVEPRERMVQFPAHFPAAEPVEGPADACRRLANARTGRSEKSLPRPRPVSAWDPLCYPLPPHGVFLQVPLQKI